MKKSSKKVVETGMILLHQHDRQVKYYDRHLATLIREKRRFVMGVDEFKCLDSIHM
jgi:hypothetical protein